MFLTRKLLGQHSPLCTGFADIKNSVYDKFSVVVFFALLLISCANLSSAAPEQDALLKFRTGSIALPSGRTFPIKLVFSATEHARGLSGVRPSDFPDDMGMFFYSSKSTFRRFWMPDTYFDLDILFLDENLRIVHVSKDMKAHPGRQTPPRIARTPRIFARYVLEIKANSPISKNLQKGIQLEWNAPYSLREIEQNIHSIRESSL